MSIIRIGSNEKYAQGWDKAFGKGKKATKSTKSAAPKKKTAKKAAKKKAAKKKKA